jgi:glycosyltransferase involved in cell wall biosynthesis
MSSASSQASERGRSLSVVAPTYERRAALPRFVRPLLADPAVSELVLAVDGSTDGSLEWLREQARADPRVVVLDLPNGGAAAARQAGIEAATGDVVLLLDDDVIAAPGLASGHARNHQDGARRLVLGYMPTDWRSLPPGRRGIAYLYNQAYERQCARYAHDPDFVLSGLWGGNFSLPREELVRVGMGEITVRRGEEDREFGIRCLKSGIEGRFDRGLLAAHDYDRTLAQYRRDCHMAGQSRRIMYELHGDVLGEDLSHGHTLPRPLRRLLPRFAGEPLFKPLAALLTALFHVGAVLRSLELESFAARGLGSLETQRGALESTVS